MEMGQQDVSKWSSFAFAVTGFQIKVIRLTEVDLLKVSSNG